MLKVCFNHTIEIINKRKKNIKFFIQDLTIYDGIPNKSEDILLQMSNCLENTLNLLLEYDIHGEALFIYFYFFITLFIVDGFQMCKLKC